MVAKMRQGFLVACIALALCLSAVSSFNINEYERLIRSIIAEPEYMNAYNEHMKMLLEIEPNYFDYTPFDDKNFTFDCNVSAEASHEPATSVHRLRPSDIKVVAALGDSLTAALGNNARTILGLLVEYRGRSWSIGGAKTLEKLVTMPNILKKFNPNLFGYTSRSDIALFNDDGVGFNAAVSGQESNHIPDQIKTLISRLKSSKQVDFENDWKLVTLFIGGNDLCRFCKEPNVHTPEAYIGDIQEGLDILYQQVPRVFVNLVSVLNVSHVRELNNGLICNLLHTRECRCAAFPKGNEYETLKEYMHQYRNYTEELVNSGRYDGRDDFAVVVQPFFKEFTTPRLPDGKIDYSYLAPDCFHFSTKGHATAAIGLWNNMLQPVGQKSTNLSPNERILCPTDQNPYLFTNKNSNL